jgi:hypothetical protein
MTLVDDMCRMGFGDLWERIFGPEAFDQRPIPPMDASEAARLVVASGPPLGVRWISPWGDPLAAPPPEGQVLHVLPREFEDMHAQAIAFVLDRPGTPLQLRMHRRFPA